ncbi:helix-turn-helix domain-containing protein [Microbacterium forte]
MEEGAADSVEEAATRLAVSLRTLQRLAHRHVGVSPAAMIRRRRLQEAAEHLRLHPSVDLADLAADLGYADHAHLTRDFRNVLGIAPRAYRASSAQDVRSAAAPP